MKNKFNIYFGSMRCGWQSISIYNNNSSVFCASASYAFSPYYDLNYLLNFLTKKPFKDKYFKKHLGRKSWLDDYYNSFTKLRNGVFNFIIDQEGYDGIIQFKIRGNSIYITTNTLKNSKKESYATGGRKRTIKYKKNDVINNLLLSLINLQKNINKNKWEEPTINIYEDDSGIFEFDDSMTFGANENINKFFKHSKLKKRNLKYVK